VLDELDIHVVSLLDVLSRHHIEGRPEGHGDGPGSRPGQGVCRQALKVGVPGDEVEAAVVDKAYGSSIYHIQKIYSYNIILWRRVT